MDFYVHTRKTLIFLNASVQHIQPVTETGCSKKKKEDAERLDTAAALTLDILALKIQEKLSEVTPLFTLTALCWR